MPNKKAKGKAQKPQPMPDETPNVEPETEVENPQAPLTVPRLLGRALKILRKRYTGTQEEFAARTEKSQSYVSAAERGKSGWDSVSEWANAVGVVGGDPIDLLRLAVAEADLDPELREVLALWASSPAHVRGAILVLLRDAAAGRVGR